MICTQVGARGLNRVLCGNHILPHATTTKANYDWFSSWIAWQTPTLLCCGVSEWPLSNGHPYTKVTRSECQTHWGSWQQCKESIQEACLATDKPYPSVPDSRLSADFWSWVVWLPGVGMPTGYSQGFLCHQWHMYFFHTGSELHHTVARLKRFWHTYAQGLTCTSMKVCPRAIQLL